ncbi:PEP/pyruvate-binding domain-containing protein, partial [Kaistella sp.]|uniref:PEP/pyruvate-binding domain-containing protein n=1 Tax=Kaistella sp. TaxID=2782235 RepID=UPI002F94E362
MTTKAKAEQQVYSVDGGKANVKQSVKNPIVENGVSNIKDKYVYSFGGGKADGNESMKNLLGGKGANLAEMAGHKDLKLPVPPGFTVTTEVCTYFYNHNRTYPAHLEKQIKNALAEVEKLMGKKFGDVKDPLLMSVRSGA